MDPAHTSVIVDASIDAIPELMTRAVHSLARVSLIEVSASGALITRRTTFALSSDTTRFSFHSRPDRRTEVRAEYTVGGVMQFGHQSGVVGEAGRAVLDALKRVARDHD
jgi:hypothetical protein